MVAPAGEQAPKQSKRELLVGDAEAQEAAAAFRKAYFEGEKGPRDPKIGIETDPAVDGLTEISIYDGMQISMVCGRAEQMATALQEKLFTIEDFARYNKISEGGQKYIEEVKTQAENLKAALSQRLEIIDKAIKEMAKVQGYKDLEQVKGELEFPEDPAKNRVRLLMKTKERIESVLG
ncbi:MAG: hypothetical protein ABH835_04795 [Patescibacteria group bacterium]